MHATGNAAPVRPIRLAVLLSGSGRTLANIADAGRLDARIEIVISSRPGVLGLERAAKLAVTTHVVPRKQYQDVESFSADVFKLIRRADVDLVCLAGWLCLLKIPDDFANRIINIHPALLPGFGGPGMYGRRVHQAVLAAGCKVTGCTVHFADQTYDTGPIILRRTCQVQPDDTSDTLAARVFEQECIAYPQAIQLIAEGRVQIEGRRTRILPPNI